MAANRGSTDTKRGESLYGYPTESLSIPIEGREQRCVNRVYMIDDLGQRFHSQRGEFVARVVEAYPHGRRDVRRDAVGKLTGS